MSVTRATLGATGSRWRAPVTSVSIALLVTAAGASVSRPGLLRPVLLLAVLPVAAAIGLLAPSRLVYGLAIWLPALGLVRRLIDTTAPSASGRLGGLGDPLLLVEPMVMVLLTAVALRTGAFRQRTRLANAVLVLTILCLVEVVNPLQGSPLVGLGGLPFLLIPLLAFWVGRALVDDILLRRVLVLVAALGVPAAIYGLFQQFARLPSWDQAWVKSTAYGALDVGGTIRAFGTFSAASEYATYLAIGVVVFAALTAKRSVALLSLPAAALLSYAVFLESSRGVVVLGVGALGLMVAARRHLRPVQALVGGAFAIGILIAVTGHFAGSSPALSSSPQAALVQHQVQGLANPLNSKDSTLNIHFSEMVLGLRSSVADPIGHGTGSVTIAASRYGGNSQGTEVDPSNVGVAFGVIGLVAYLVAAASGLMSTYRIASQQRAWWTSGALGLLVVTFLQWTNGGQYAVAWLPWLVLGWVDRRSLQNAQSVNAE